MYKKDNLSNNLKLITVPMEGTKTITVLVMFGTGSKYENKENNGISHFLEHMFFKGTEKRPTAMELSSDLDAMGSEYNAFTSKEYTGYWIKVDASKAEQAMDIVSDMLASSKFDVEEIEREKGVIIEEINMYHDNPMMYIEDLFEQCLYGDTPAGWEIIGPKENIKKFGREEFVKYFESQYGTDEAVVCITGKVGDKEKALAEKYFSKIKDGEFKEKVKTIEEQSEAKIMIHEKEVDQANLSIGVRSYDMYHPDRYILKMMAIILGGSMSSRLFSEVREKRGLAYYVRTQSDQATDTGYLTTQAGVPVGKQNEAIEVILKEYKKLTEELVPVEELQRAKDLLKGRTVIRLEASDDVANWYARQVIFKQDILNPDEFFKKINGVNSEDIKRVAKNIFKSEKLNLAIIGPFKDKKEFKDIVKL